MRNPVRDSPSPPSSSSSSSVILKKHLARFENLQSSSVPIKMIDAKTNFLHRTIIFSYFAEEVKSLPLLPFPNTVMPIISHHVFHSVHIIISHTHLRCCCHPCWMSRRSYRNNSQNTRTRSNNNNNNKM